MKGEGGTIAHAFLAKMRSGHIGVFQRGGHGANNASLPIEKAFRPIHTANARQSHCSRFIQKRMEERLAVNVEHEVNAFLMGFRR